MSVALNRRCIRTDRDEARSKTAEQAGRADDAEPLVPARSVEFRVARGAHSPGKEREACVSV